MGKPSASAGPLGQRGTRPSYAAALGAVVCTLLGTVTARAEETGDAPEPPSSVDPSGSTPQAEVHAFVSQGFIKSARNEYLAKSKGGSFEFTEIGINFTKPLAPDLRAGVQLFGHELGPSGNYQPEFDWFYVDYRFRDWLGIRVGRTKMPFGLYNEVNDIDVARVPILLPQAIYPVDHREFLFAQTGVELYGDLSLSSLGSLEYRVYGGTLFTELPPAPGPGVTVLEFNVPYVAGARLFWSTPVDGLLLGASAQWLRFDADYGISPEILAVLQSVGLVGAEVSSPLDVKFRVPRYVGSLQYLAHELDLSIEYSRWIGNFESPAPLLFPPHTVNERYYLMASYRVRSWFTPGVYYSALYPNVKDRQGRDAYQHDWALTARYDLNAHWILKLEGHIMRGTAALDNRALNDAQPASALARDWGVFLIKTTGYF